MTKAATGDTAPVVDAAHPAASGTTNAAASGEAKVVPMTEQVERELLGKPNPGSPQTAAKVEATVELKEKIEDAVDAITDLEGQLAAADEGEKAEIQTQLDAKRAELAELEKPADDDAAAAETETDETTDQDEHAEETDDDPALKGKLSADLQATIHKRIGKEVGKRKAAEEAAEAAKTESEMLRQQVAELQAKVDDKELPARAAATGLHPTLLIETAEGLAARKDTVVAAIEWAEYAIEKARDDGERDDAGKLIWRGTGSDGKETIITTEALLAQKQELARELNRVIPDAERSLASRQTADADARKLYPDLFKAGSTDAQLMASLLKKVPGLRTLPNAKVLIGDMIAGEKARLAAKNKTTVQKVVKQAPPAPAGSAMARGTSPLASRKPQMNISMKDSETGKSGKGLVSLMEAFSEKPNRKVA